MTAPDDHEHFLQVAIEAARKAGAVIKEAFDKPKDVQEKTAVTDLVTATDQQAEKLIYDHLKQAFPDHLFIGEEGSSAQGFTSDLTGESLLSAKQYGPCPCTTLRDRLSSFVNECQAKIKVDAMPPHCADRPTWMCDPLDGTTNFVHSFPFVCVSLALVINRETVVGVVFR